MTLDDGSSGTGADGFLHISGTAMSIARRLGGFALRLVECAWLREKLEINIGRIQIIVCRDKEIERRTSMSPEQLSGS
jgi:hypothetical protein